MLQRVFFHDILITIGKLTGYSEQLPETYDEEADEFKSVILSLSQKLTDEAVGQQQLIAAENGTLNVLSQNISSTKIMNSVIQLC